MLTRTSPRVRIWCPFALTALLSAAACSSSSGSGTGGGTTGTGGGATTTSSSGTTATGTGGGAMCPGGPGYGSMETTMQVDSVTATINDLTGAPIAGLTVFVCGTNICSNPATTNAQGNVVVTPVNPANMQKKPAFKYGDALTYTKLAIPLTMATTTFPTLMTGALPQMGAAFTPGGDVVSGNVTLTLAKGTTVTVDELNYDTPDKQLFRAVQIPVDQIKPVLDPTMLGLEVVYGTAPIETTFCPAAQVSVPNTPAWPAGTAVEFYAHGLETGEEWAPYAGWTKISDGAVSADGKTIATDAAGGFPVLETFGIRKKP